MAKDAKREVRTLPENFHADSTIMEIPVSEVKVDRSYQRDLSNSLVDSIAEKWDEVASELILVSDRGAGRKNEWPEKGRYYIVNGQHRTAAAVKKGLETIWARVVNLKHVEDPALIEADLRIKTNVRLGDRPQERFKAQLRAGNPESQAISKLLAQFDTEINIVPTMDHGVNAVSTVEALYRVDDGAILRETLQVLKDAYGHVGGKSASAPLLKGLAWFVQTHAGESDRGRLVEKVSELGYAATDRRARTIQSTLGGSMWTNFYRTLVDLYNERLPDKNRLEWRLRGASTWAGRGSSWGRGTK